MMGENFYSINAPTPLGTFLGRNKLMVFHDLYYVFLEPPISIHFRSAGNVVPTIEGQIAF